MKITYDKEGRMQFNEEFHFNHGKPWKNSDQKYLIERWNKDRYVDISLALGRTYATIADRICTLKKQGVIKTKKSPNRESI